MTPEPAFAFADGEGGHSEAYSGLELRVAIAICEELFGGWQATGYEIKKACLDGARHALVPVDAWMEKPRYPNFPTPEVKQP